MNHRSRSLLTGAALASLAIVSPALAEVTPQRTWTTLVSSNGHGAVVVELQPSGGAQIHHFREHIFATEEPLIDASGNDVFVNGKPQSVFARDLLFDTYFGLRANGDQRWLKSLAVDLDASGFEGTTAGGTGGTGIVRMVQRWNNLEATQYVFAPFGLEHAGFVMIARIRNTGSSSVSGVSTFTLNNFHLGFGRPGANQETGEEYETIAYSSTHDAFEERGFAGVMVSRALGGSTHHGASDAASPAGSNVWQIVENGGTASLPDLAGEAPTANGSVSAFQKDHGALAAGQSVWFGVASAHHGDPFAAATVEGWLSAWVAGRAPEQILDDERTAWASFQAGLTLPSGLTPEQEALYRQSAVVLRMAQVREDEMYLRAVLTDDATPRRTRFGTTLGGPPAALPAVVKHRGKGAVLASLPPGEWTYAWPRDGAYAIIGMSLAGMQTEAKAALEFYLNAEGGRFRNYSELSTYGMPDYRISLVRYHGFGVEETDYNDYGPNLEFDGFGLFLWALRTYTDVTNDASLRSSYYDEYTTRVADALVALVDPATGLIRKDSSIWESHWNGRERSWTYTNITAARGLCDAAALASAEGDAVRAATYAAAGESLREAIATRLTDGNGALASNAEELAAGQGYWDAAVLDGIAMGLFDPTGPIATATLSGIHDHLHTNAGVGWARNDDNFDNGANDVSPWGSEYDDAEWVITDMRGAVALRMKGDTAFSDQLIEWVRRQSAVNYLEVAETYDQNTGAYKFNAPMVGFGAGAWIISVNHALGGYAVEPACGAYYQESGTGGTGGTGGSGGTGGAGGTAGTGGGGGTGGAAGSSGSGGDAGTGGTGPAGAGGTDTGGSAGASGVGASAGGGGAAYAAPGEDDGGCGCRTNESNASGVGWAGLLAAIGLLAMRRNRAR